MVVERLQEKRCCASLALSCSSLERSLNDIFGRKGQKGRISLLIQKIEAKESPRNVLRRLHFHFHFLLIGRPRNVIKTLCARYTCAYRRKTQTSLRLPMTRYEARSKKKRIDVKCSERKRGCVRTHDEKVRETSERRVGGTET